jgi:predicted nucleic acid-binding protein
MSIWVADAGPLIFLAKLDHLELLRSAGIDVYVPAAVIQEIRSKDDEASSAIEEASSIWLQIRSVDNLNAVELLLADLDSGEAEVIALAREIKADWVLLDDLDARRFARRVGLSPVGTLGLLLAARLRGKIPSLGTEIQRLQEHGFWISDLLKERILKAAGEVDPE